MPPTFTERMMFAHRRICELHKYCSHAVISLGRPRPPIAVGYPVLDGHAGSCSQFSRFGHPNFGDVERVEAKTLSRQPDVVAPFAIGHAQQAAARAPLRCMLAQVCVGSVPKT
jgi:hypothetical protein